LDVCYARDAADIVKLLIDKGADVNARRADDRETALMWAAQIADLDLVRLLLKNGADVHAKDCHGKTALRRLVEDGDAGGGFWDANRMAQFEHDKPEVIRLLKRAGAADE
jgi:ankyrin repeat protein